MAVAATSARTWPASTSEAAKLPPQLPALTGLRIFAALAVYLSHVGPPHNAPVALKTFMASGYMGVTVFFVLSGFVLTLNYFDEFLRPTAQRTWKYGVARFARIYPLYILILLYILVRRHAFGEDLSGWWEHVLALQAWDANVAHAYDFNAPAWSVSVELFLYACFPLLVMVLAGLRRPRAIIGAAAIVVLGMAALTLWFVVEGRGSLSLVDPASAHRWLYRMPLTRLGDFALGILAARLYLEVKGARTVMKLSGWLVAAAGITTLALMAWPTTLDSAWSWDVLYAVPAVLMIFGLAMAPGNMLARGLSLPLLVMLGEASYAFYLIHKSALEYFGAGRWAAGTSPTTVVYEMLTLGAIICMAVGLHILVERPARRYIRRIAGATDDVARGRPWHGPAERLP